MKNETDLLNGLTAKTYLKLLIKQKKQLHYLKEFRTISLCETDLNIHVYRGIHELARAAGKELHAVSRSCSDYPIELNFKYKGITFFQLEP